MEQKIRGIFSRFGFMMDDVLKVKNYYGDLCKGSFWSRQSKLNLCVNEFPYNIEQKGALRSAGSVGCQQTGVCVKSNVGYLLAIIVIFSGFVRAPDFSPKDAITR